ncbi:methionine--tRNA ligase [Candidatus Pelagibacter sp.]|nr:methionine--tRNA ligase [Candidatus Pelagibacter sp.]
MTKSFYITTPIYYPSAKPHMGHAYSSIVSDVIARFKRLDGYEVEFLTGTDEHGLKIQRAAEEKGIEPKKFCDDISETFRNLSNTLNLSNTDFIRTTEDRHIKSVQNLWKILEEKNQIYLSKYSGWYSVSDEAFYNQDEIKEENGINISINSGSKVEWLEEESYFFKLSEWENKLLKFYEENPKFILPKSRRNEVISFVKSGLKDLSVSRKTFSWGIKVPGNKDHVIYVWLDALTNYISALNYPDTKNNKYKNFWPADIHMIGKDILRFHAIYWPAFLLAADLPPPKRVYGHGWILSGDEKMSKSKGNILDPLEIVNKYGLDSLRFYLLKEVSFGNDGNITQEKLESCINSDLANNYGNLCQRVISFNEKNCNLLVPDNINFEKDDLKLLNKISDNINKLRSYIDNQELSVYTNFIIDCLFDANKYFNDQEPWKKKSNVTRLNTIIYVSLEIIRKVSILLNPIIPDTSLKVLDIFSLKQKDINFDTIKDHKCLTPNSNIKKIGILFKKIEKND